MVLVSKPSESKEGRGDEVGALDTVGCADGDDVGVEEGIAEGEALGVDVGLDDG